MIFIKQKFQFCYFWSQKTGIKNSLYVQAKGTRLGYGLIKNHCMLDGNKRIGIHAMLVFFALNGIELRYTQKELYKMVLSVADGSLEYEDMLRWVLEHQE